MEQPETSEGVTPERKRSLRSMRPKPVDINTVFRTVVWYVVGGILFVISLRVVLLLLVASPDNLFARVAYKIGEFFARPIHIMFGFTPSYGSFTVEWQSLVAIGVYGALALLIITISILIAKLRK